MKLAKKGRMVVVVSLVAWERAFLSAMSAKGILWVPLFHPGEALPCAVIHTTTQKVWSAEGQVAEDLAVVLHDEDWHQLERQDRPLPFQTA